jgi:uncharacterized membrane protein YgcG
VTSQEPQTPFSANVDEMHETEVIVVSTPAPVFVDSTGRRSRVLRRLAYGFGALCMLYGGLVSVSLAGGPVSSSAVLPLPDLHGGSDSNQVAEERPAPSPAPTVTPSPRPMFATEALPRRPVSATSDLRPDTRRPAAAGATRTPDTAPTRKTPSPSTTGATKPVESTTTPTTPPPSTTPPPVETDPPGPNVPPAPPAPGGTGGGTGGGAGGTGSSGSTGSSGGGSAGADDRDEEPIAAPPAPPPVVAPVSDPADEPADGEGTDEVGA